MLFNIFLIDSTIQNDLTLTKHFLIVENASIVSIRCSYDQENGCESSGKHYFNVLTRK